ncbi:MAG: ATP-binding cassette domain-containing protein [Collinsella sp.]
MLFAFLLMVSRIYAPFDQALMLMSELFAAESSAKRMRSIMEEPVARGSENFKPAGHDVVFDHVAFGYGAGEDGRAGEKVLTDVSFTAKEGEVTALVGPSGSGKSTVSRLAARFWDATAGGCRGRVDVAGVIPRCCCATTPLCSKTCCSLTTR